MTFTKTLQDYAAKARYKLKDALGRPIALPPANLQDAQVCRPCMRPLPPANNITELTIPSQDRRLTTLDPIESDHMTRADYVSLILHTEKSYTGGLRTTPPPRRNRNVRKALDTTK